MRQITKAKGHIDHAHQQLAAMLKIIEYFSVTHTMLGFHNRVIAITKLGDISLNLNQGYSLRH
jgi:hypothetical protein